ncbi:MAG: hypothetical protein ACAI38_01550 [Myxococcota bacterium]
MSFSATALKTANATGGALLLALVLPTALLAVLPLRPELAFAICAHAVVPLWVTLACVLPLAGRRH